MTRSIIDPITRIEGHLRLEMEVDNGVVTDAWVSGGCSRGMELVVQDRTPEDAAQIVQRICGVCPVSHTHASSLAGEAAYGIVIPNQARIIRNLVEGGQFLHSHILWLYTLAALDYVNPLNALNANVGKAYDLMEAAGTSCSTDLKTLMGTLTKFANNGQLSIFSGGWFLDGQAPEAYKLDPEADLICTAHYLEALNMQAKASEICGLIGGKMPHIMTLVPGGTAFVPTEEKLDELYSITREIRDWVDSTMLPDTKIIASAYPEALGFGRGCGRYVAWGVFQRENFEMADRYMPSGVVYTNDGLRLEDPDPSLIKEYVGHSWYVGDSNLNPKEGVTDPLYTEYYVAGTEHEENGHMIGTVNGLRARATMVNAWRQVRSPAFSQLICVVARRIVTSSTTSTSSWQTSTSRFRSSSPRSVVLLHVRLNAPTSLTSWSIGSTNSSKHSRVATVSTSAHLSTLRVMVAACGKHRVALSTMTSMSTMVASLATRSSFLLLGISLRAMLRAFVVRWSRLLSVRRSLMSMHLSMRFVPSTASTPVLLAQFMCLSLLRASTSKPLPALGG